MTSVQNIILKAVEKFNIRFERVTPAGDDAVVFYIGGIKIAIRYYSELDTYQVIRRGVAGVFNSTGIAGVALAQYLTPQYRNFLIVPRTELFNKQEGGRAMDEQNEDHDIEIFLRIIEAQEGQEE